MREGIRTFLAFAFLLSALSWPASVQGDESVERDFRAWLASQVVSLARARGISKRVIDEAIGGISLKRDLPGLQLPGADDKAPRRQSQAEFRAPARYFRENQLAPLVATGRDRQRDHRDLLARLQETTGVPGHIVVAIWGRESGFGRASIPHKALDVLATRAFLSERRELFTQELVAALELLDRTGFSPSSLRSSWAGAMGQPQFLPTSYLQHAEDGDGDGRADIWNSQADTLASIANYLASHGWVAGRDWGFEVAVPDSVPCHLEGPDRGRSIAQWETMGIQRVSGRPFPEHERTGEAFLLMPAGRLGPAFLVTPNFYVLKKYNESDAYALFVGHAGDRIAFGGRPFQGVWQPVAEMLRSDIAGLQRRLEAMGHDVGGADGLAGYKTRRSIGTWQAANGIKPTCYPDPALLARIR